MDSGTIPCQRCRTGVRQRQSLWLFGRLSLHQLEAGHCIALRFVRSRSFSTQQSLVLAHLLVRAKAKVFVGANFKFALFLPKGGGGKQHNMCCEQRPCATQKQKSPRHSLARGKYIIYNVGQRK